MTPKYAAHAWVFGKDIEEAMRFFEAHRVEPHAVRWNRVVMQHDKGMSIPRILKRGIEALQFGVG